VTHESLHTAKNDLSSLSENNTKPKATFNMPWISNVFRSDYEY